MSKTIFKIVGTPEFHFHYPSPDAADVNSLHIARQTFEEMVFTMKAQIAEIRQERIALRGAIDTLQTKAGEAFSTLERKIEELKVGNTDNAELTSDLNEILSDLRDARQDVESTVIPEPEPDPADITAPGSGSNPINNPIDVGVNAAGGDPITGSGRPRPADPVPADPANSTGIPAVGSTTSAPDPSSQTAGLGLHHDSDSSNPIANPTSQPSVFGATDPRNPNNR